MNFKEYLKEHQNKMNLTLLNSEKKTLIINAFGGAGSGKTKSCKHIASALEKRGYSVAYIPEYINELIKGNEKDLINGTQENQFKILKEQLTRTDELLGKVDFILTDSPILQNGIYNKELTTDYEEMLKGLNKQYQSFNYFVVREKGSFNPAGRLQNESESLQKDYDIKDMLYKNSIFYGEYNFEDIGKVIDNSIKSYNRINGNDRKYFNLPYLPKDEYRTVAVDFTRMGATYDPKVKKWYVKSGQETEIQNYINELKEPEKKDLYEKHLPNVKTNIPINVDEAKNNSAVPNSINAVDLIGDIENIYQVGLINGEIINLNTKEIIQNAGVESASQLNALNVVEAIEKKIQEEKNIIETDKGYSIVVGKEHQDNSCSIIFHNDNHCEELLGDQFGVNFPTISTEKIKETIDRYMSQQTNKKINMEIETFVSLTVAKTIFTDNETEKTIGYEVKSGIIKQREIVNNQTIFGIEDKNGYYFFINEKDIFSENQIKLIDKAKENLPAEQYDLLLSCKNGVQMNEIYSGFEMGLSTDQVALYAKEEIPSWKMELYKYGMLQGLSYQSIDGVFKNGLEWDDCRRLVDDKVKSLCSKISHDVIASGFEPNKRIIKGIRELNTLQNKNHTMQDICNAYKEKLYDGKSSEIINDLAKQFKVQEISLQRTVTM